MDKFDEDRFNELMDRTPVYDYCKKCVEADENDVNALLKLGECYYFGTGTKENKKEARKTFKRAIKLDSANKLAKKYNREILCDRIFWLLGYLFLISIFIGFYAILPTPKKEFKNYQESIKINPSDSDSWYNLGVCYDSGKGTEEDDVLAFECYLKAVETSEGKEISYNIVNAYLNLGLCYMNGTGTEQDYNKAYVIFEKLLTLDETLSDAWFNLGVCNVARKISKEDYDKVYNQIKREWKISINDFTKDFPYFVYFADPSFLTDFILTEDYEKSREYFRKSTDINNHKEAIFYLDSAFSDIDPEWYENYLINNNPNSTELILLAFNYDTDLKVDQKRCFEYLEKAIKVNENNSSAYFSLGLCYLEGIGTEINEKEAFRCLKKSNELDPSTASYWYLLGAFYKSGFGTKINEKKAFECYKKANELDLSNAEYWYELAICYDGGYGTEVDRVKAFECYKKANELDPLNAEYWNQLGICYDGGFGTEVDEAKAFEYFEKANDLDPEEGLYWSNLGFCYEYGIGTDIEEKRAFEYYQKAYELGNTLVLEDLGRCYLHGIGTDFDLDKAQEFLDKAQELYPEDEEINELLKELEEQEE